MIGMRPLRDETEYDAAITEIDRLFDAEIRPGSPEQDRLDLLALLVADYERRVWPIEDADPVDVVRYRMETGGYSQADLGRVLGSRQRASEVLAGKRDLSLAMIRRLARDWDIPAAALIGGTSGGAGRAA